MGDGNGAVTGFHATNLPRLFELPAELGTPRERGAGAILGAARNDKRTIAGLKIAAAGLASWSGQVGFRIGSVGRGL